MLTPDEIFILHPKIRWVGASTSGGEIVFSKMRPGVQTITTEEDDRNLLEMGSLLLRGIAERSSQFAGRVGCIAVLYEKFGQLIVQRNANNIILTFDNDHDAPSTLHEIIEIIEKI